MKPEKSQALTESDLRHPETGRSGYDQMPDYGSSGVEMILVDVLDPKLVPYLHKHGISAATVDRGEGRRRSVSSVKIKPRLLLGLRVQCPVERKSGRPCPGCLSRPLEEIAYCCACNASGLDAILPPVPKHELPKAYKPADAKLAGGVGKKKAKGRGEKRASRNASIN